MSMWLQDIEQMEADELKGLCEELEMKLEEGRAELTRKEEFDVLIIRCAPQDGSR